MWVKAAVRFLKCFILRNLSKSLALKSVFKTENYIANTQIVCQGLL